jgi:hypothetical protein
MMRLHTGGTSVRPMLTKIKAGTLDRGWVDATLTRLGCFIE